LTFEYHLPGPDSTNDWEAYNWEDVGMTRTDFATKIRERADIYRNVVPT
jgi:hypothetical protein